MEPPPSKSPSPPLNPRGLTVWVVAVHVPLLALVQPVSVVNDADFPKPAVGAGLDNGISNTSLVEPPGCTHVETWTEDVTEKKNICLMHFIVEGHRFPRKGIFPLFLCPSLPFPARFFHKNRSGYCPPTGHGKLLLKLHWGGC